MKVPRDVELQMNAKIAKINLLGVFKEKLAQVILEDYTLVELLFEKAKDIQVDFSIKILTKIRHSKA